MILPIHPALVLNCILAVASKVAKAKAKGSAAAAEGGGSENDWLDIASELATAMFADEANKSITQWRERIAERFSSVHAPENRDLERALAKSSILASILWQAYLDHHGTEAACERSG